jgi:hypothetical protein
MSNRDTAVYEYSVGAWLVFGKPAGFQELQLPQHSSEQAFRFEETSNGNNWKQNSRFVSNCFHFVTKRFCYEE